jgi:hypothetical protein
MLNEVLRKSRESKVKRPCLSGPRSAGRNKTKGKEKKMRKGILLVLVLGLMVFCATKDSNAQAPAAPPVIEKVWASPVYPIGGLIKIYIKASDPNADMKWLYISAGFGKQAVLGAVPLRLKGGKDLNGYVYWDSRWMTTGNVQATVEFTVEDAAGKESEAKSVTFELKKGKDIKAEKAPADFQEKEIGPIMRR